MYEWEKVCFTCEVEEERSGKFFCSTTNPKCKIKHLVDKGEIPSSALRSGAPIIKQNIVGFADVPLWQQQDKMTDFCANVIKFPESIIRWND